MNRAVNVPGLIFALASSLLPVLPFPAHAQPAFESAVAQAREAARSDRNREAADRFAEAIRTAPARRRELLQEYADQLLYSDRAAQAVPLYREALASPLSDDERRRSEKGLGLALLWTDRPGEAAQVYRKILSERPDDEEASRNLGRALSWSGRQREAIAQLESHLGKHPGDAEARLQLAQSQAWLGQAHQARRTLDAATDPQDPGARKLRRQLELDSSPRTVVDAQRSSQSDQLVIRDARIAQSVGFADGRGTVGVQAERFEYDGQQASDSARVTRPMAVARYRFNEGWEIHAQAGQDRIRMADGTRHDPGVYAAWLTWWPNDTLRFDASTNRETFDNLQSLRLGLTTRQNGLSVDFVPDERTRYTARLQHGEYSDGNRRDWGQLETEYRFRTHPEVWGGLRYTQFTFAEQMNNGYFNPQRFQAAQVTARALWHPRGDEGPWEVGAYGAVGREHAVPDGNKPAYDLSVRAAYRFDSQTRLEARAQRFSSRTNASTGFARTIFGVALERSW